MPLFYLHLCDGQAYSEDEFGVEYADLADARTAAVKAIRDVTAGDAQGGTINLTSYIEVENDRHQHLATVRFADAIEVGRASVRPPREVESALAAGEREGLGG